MKVLDLFSGIGGFSLGLERAGMTTVAFCEINPYCQAVLRKHWPEVPCYDDIRTLTAERLSRDGIRPDVLCGGFPCQPFSHASHGKKTAKSLWPEMLRIMDAIRPRFVIGENVQKLPISGAARDLEGLGYRCDVKRIGAVDAGADHQRNRWWLIAHPHDNGELSSAIDAEASKLPTLCQNLWGTENFARILRVPDGVSNRMDRLKALGNAVVPQIPEIIGKAIMEYA